MMEIWDLQCHLSGLPASTPKAWLAKLLEFADRMDIDRLCIFMGMELSYDPSLEKDAADPAINLESSVQQQRAEAARLPVGRGQAKVAQQSIV